jgi:hypothetical protein
MDTWFNTPERIDTLHKVASSWVGTPFSANSRCKGERGGVSCQMLAEQIYKECGVPLPFGAESGSMSWAGIRTESLIDKFLSSKKELQAIVEPDIKEVLPGDVLGFNINKCIHHIGIALSPLTFIHCMRGTVTSICPLTDPSFKSRLAKSWRPLP